ncbi:MAG: aminotransferase class I/II-fold pyridoxal phosphate-dependent enzyme [Erysipelotrichaceae bacterium]
MKFIKNEANTTPIVDTVFSIVSLATEAIKVNGADKVVNATIGSLFNEEGKLVALDSVFNHFNEIDNITKAKYAGSFTGNASYRKQVFEWVKGNADLKLEHSVIATPGGTGAVSMTIGNILDPGETLVIPEIAWGSYNLMASDNQLDVVKYSLFKEDKFNMDSFKETCLNVLKKQNKLLVIINDPCHNPTGYSMTKEEWTEVIEFINECGKTAPSVILNDIAYIDYSYNLNNTRKYMETFNNISDNVLIVVAFSTSKSLTSYGLRCGAAVILAKDKQTVRDVEIVFEKVARATWSNITNVAMDNFTYVTTTGIEAYMSEKNYYVNLLKERSDIFIKEAKEANLECYPYKEGFFVTVNIQDNDLRDKYHSLLMDNLIFSVKVNKGIRVAICSLSVDKCKGLAPRMKQILDTIK